MHCAAGDRLVEVHVSVANLYVETAIGVAAHPSLIVDRRALAAEIRQREQVSIIACATFGPSIVFH